MDSSEFLEYSEDSPGKSANFKTPYLSELSPFGSAFGADFRKNSSAKSMKNESSYSNTKIQDPKGKTVNVMKSNEFDSSFEKDKSLRQEFEIRDEYDSDQIEIDKSKQICENDSYENDFDSSNST